MIAALPNAAFIRNLTLILPILSYNAYGTKYANNKAMKKT